MDRMDIIYSLSPPSFGSKKEPSAVCNKKSFSMGFLRPAALEDQQGNKLSLVKDQPRMTSVS